MAILGKIRQRSFFLILVIGLALFAFVISGAFGTGQGDTGPTDPIGIINEEEIPLDNFRLLVEQTQRTYGYSSLQAVNVVWNQYLRTYLFEEEYKTLGIDAGRDQIEQVVSSTESIITDPRFINEAGFFDFGLFTNFIAQMREQNSQGYEQWKNQEATIISSARESIYFDLIKAATAVTEKEAEVQYHLENDNIDLNYVQLPYSSIPDSLVTVSDADIKSYIKDNASQYERKASRALRYVAFLEQPTEEDQNIIRNGLENLIEDRIEYNDVSKLTDTLLGLKNTKRLADFIDRYSEEGFDSLYLPKGRLPLAFAEILYNLEEGEVFGPYQDIGTYKISKMLDRKENATIRASHILVAYAGAQRVDPSVTRTKEEAEALAKQYLRQVRRDKSQLEVLALQNSDGPSKSKAGDLGFVQETGMDPDFFAFLNDNPTGAVGLVETPFGFHVIKVGDKQDLVLLASVSQKIVPSEQTSNKVFKDATQFEMDAGREDFAALAESSNYVVRTVNNVDVLDENLPGLPEQRAIVQWAFSDDTSVGDIKRFSLSFGGYVIVELTVQREAGLAAVEDVKEEVLPKLLAQKKAAMLKSDNQGTEGLADLAAKNGVEVKTALAVNQKSGVLVGAGNEPYIIGAAFALQEGQRSVLLEGNNGVYQVELVAKKKAQKLDDYSSYAQLLQTQERNALAERIISALESSATIEDNRALYY